MRYLVRMGALPLPAADLLVVKGALSKVANWQFGVETCNVTEVQLNAEVVWDLGTGENGTCLDAESSRDVCRRLYKTIRRVYAGRFCAVIGMYAISENNGEPEVGEGWLWAFGPV